MRPEAPAPARPGRLDPPAAVVLLVLLCFLGACASSAPPLPAEPPSGERPDYVIGTGDRLRIVVWKNPDLSVDVPVRPDGRISVPLVDDLRAEGLTPMDLRDLIASELEEYVAAPSVSVVVLEVGSKRVHVIGEVNRPGPILLVRDHRILDAIVAAGGFREFADKGDIQIIRRSMDGEISYRFDYNAYVRGDAPGTNLLLEPDDTVIVSD